MLRTVEHVVGGDLDHPTAPLSDGMRQIGGSLGVQTRTEFLVVLGLVDSSIGGTVHDTVDLVCLDESLDGRLVGDIQLGHIRIKIGVLGILLLQQLHFVSQLAITSGN